MLLGKYKISPRVLRVGAKQTISVEGLDDVTKIYDDVDFAKGIVAKTMSGETIQEFTSRKDAVKWLQDNNFTKSDNRDNIIATIGRVANGQRKSAYGMKWENLT